jgi:O-antigen/teichoic acid export membrane protein
MMKERVLSKFSLLTNFIDKGHERSIKAKKNIIVSFLIKGISIAISIIVVPITINYINPSRYGIWLTLSSIVGWFTFFDIGLTQGLRNKFAEAKANNDNLLAQIYVSTTYAVLTMIFSAVLVIFVIINHFLNWSQILNIPESFQSEVSTLAIIVFSFFCFRFVLNIIGTILTADQQPAKASLIDVTSQIFSLLIIIILVKTTEGSLVKLGLALCVSPILVLFGTSIILFKGVYKQYKPEISKVNLFYAKKLFNLGLVFFIIQVAGIVQFETANIIIARNFGTAEVTSYNIVYKYFGMLTMVFTIFLTPFWSASTEAYLKGDIQWIKNGIKKYNFLNLIMFIGSCLMLLLSGAVYRVWLGGKVNIEFILSFWGFVFFNVTMYGSKYVFFLNSISALKIQFWACVLSPIIYIIVSLILINYYHLGISSLFIASVVANFNSYFLAPLQYSQVVNHHKKGIWVK